MTLTPSDKALLSALPYGLLTLLVTLYVGACLRFGEFPAIGWFLP